MIIGGSAGFRMMIALPLAAPPTTSTPRDIGARAGTCRAGRHRGYDLRIGYAGDARYRRYHRDRRLAAAGHHIDVLGIKIGLPVHRRNGQRADRGRSQVDDALAVAGQNFVVMLMRIGRSGVEDDADILVMRRSDQPVDAGVDRLQPLRPRLGQPIGLRVDADHRDQLQRLALFDELHHQVGADIARPDDRAFYLLRHMLVSGARNLCKSYRGGADT
jgi:hypothetical protein